MAELAPGQCRWDEQPVKGIQEGCNMVQERSETSGVLQTLVPSPAPVPFCGHYHLLFHGGASFHCH